MTLRTNVARLLARTYTHCATCDRRAGDGDLECRHCGGASFQRGPSGGAKDDPRDTMSSSLDYIQPMPTTTAHPYVRWAVVRADGWGRPQERFCDALRAAETLVAPVPREGLRDAVMAVYVLLVALVGLLVADWKGM